MSLDITSLERTVEEYEKRAVQAREFFARADQGLKGAERDLNVAREFLETERRRQSAQEVSPLAGMTLGEALASILRRLGHATADQLIEAVTREGWEFEKPATGRTVHTALMRVDGVRKIAPKTYETYEVKVGSNQPAATGVLTYRVLNGKDEEN